MILELYGTNNVLTSKIGKEVMSDINKFTEDRGGVLSLTSFTIYTMNHSMLLFPIFRIQRTIQKKIMGLNYWKDVEINREKYFTSNKNKHFDPRHVQILLRTYKTGAAAAILTHTGDPNVALKQQYDEDNQEANDEDITSRSLYCPLDDLDMLYLQENFVMTQLLHKSFFDEELTRIREKAIEKGHQVMTKKELFEPFGGEL